MTIGILTFQASNNYGALLQAYALQESIIKMNKEVEIINYISPAKQGWYKPFDFSIKKSLKHNLRQMLKIPNYFYVKNKNKKTQIFKDNTLNISPEKFIGRSSQFEYYVNKYETIVVGSDQVWNYVNTSFDKVYLLDLNNSNIKKISYSASFGMEMLESSYESDYKKLLGEFQAISVREKSGKNIINKLLPDKNIEVTLDPTLLLTKEDWSMRFPVININPERVPYILVYTIGKDKKLDHIAKFISEEFQLKIIRIKRDFRDISFSDKNINPSVEDFMAYINNANLILTNSFHGVAFSINFKKDFYVYLKENNKANTRIENLLQITNLNHRIINSKDDLSKLDSIDFDIPIHLLNKERLASLKYIEKEL